MKKKIMLSSMVFAGLLYAADPVDYIFSVGDVIKSSEMNSNFQKLVDYISSLESKVSTLETQVGNLQDTTSSTKVFLGVSSTSVAANSGFMGMNNACENTYSGSRMCTSNDIAANIYTDGTLTGNAWINPSVVYTDADGAPYDNYGNRAHSCSGWRFVSTSFNWGSVVSLPKGSISGTASCATTIPVACCK